MSVLERDVSKKWMKDYLKKHPDEYGFRIHDCPWGRKDFDGFLMTATVVWAVEFKVDRRKTYAFTKEEVPAHQISALEDFANGKNRRSKVVVYHVATESWHEFEIPCKEKRDS